ncbi:MAG: radical SAM family heme chaperone HemW [Opitutales bacterium]
MKAQAKDPLKNPLGLYIHVPFCATTCDFCAFYQKRPERGDMDAYISGIESELDSYDPEVLSAVKTVFWGGGTPGLLAPRDLERLGNVMLEKIGNAWSEWSIEMAPITVHPDRVRVLKDLGANRISMGVQSFDDDLLDALGRTHPRKKIFQAWDIFQKAGFENINLDLIFAVPGQSDAALVSDLQEAIALGPKHISTYCLTFEEDTKLWVKLSKGEIKRDPNAEERHYRLAWDTLDAAGYPQYEISNFARPGFACQHNIHTWRMHDWIGVGPSASSQYHGQRFTNPSSLQEWRTGIESGNLDTIRIDQVSLDEAILTADRLGFGLRMNEGIPFNTPISPGLDTPLAQHPIWHWLLNLVENGLAEISDERLRLTLDGRLVADAIAREILERFEPVEV